MLLKNRAGPTDGMAGEVQSPGTQPGLILALPRWHNLFLIEGMGVVRTSPSAVRKDCGDARWHNLLLSHQGNGGDAHSPGWGGAGDKWPVWHDTDLGVGVCALRTSPRGPACARPARACGH